MKSLALNAHGGGRWWGVICPNCIEAFESAYKHGFRNIEVDISITRDGKFVAGHNYWEIRAMSESEWLRHPVRTWLPFRVGTTVNLDGLDDFAARHPDVKWMFDFHLGFRMKDRGPTEEYSFWAKEFVEALRSRSFLQGKVLIEVYSKAQVDAFIQAGFYQIQLWIEAFDGNLVEFESVEAAIRFCGKKGIHNLSVPKSLISKHPDAIQLFKNHEIAIFSPGWNTMLDRQSAVNLGLDFITVDTYTPDSSWMIRLKESRLLRGVKKCWCHMLPFPHPLA